jgi:glyoxylase-like metal-dependent hydrolase (beta-lactamase superfamily II)
MTYELPQGLFFFERGWLSSNSVFLDNGQEAVLVDTGYVTQAPLLLSYLSDRLNKRSLDIVVNTHLHSDHCGGNHALQTHFPGVKTFIPFALFDAVCQWSSDKLSFETTGQRCERFTPTHRLFPADVCEWAGFEWEVHACPGHDHDALLFFNRQHRILISADALWANGFGVVFPEIMSSTGFKEVSDSLNLIKHLDPVVVLPGHGPIITNLGQALDSAFARLKHFVDFPLMHAAHAAKVLLKFKLLQQQSILLADFEHWALATPLLTDIHGMFFTSHSIGAWLDKLVQELVLKKAAVIDKAYIHNA